MDVLCWSCQNQEELRVPLDHPVLEAPRMHILPSEPPQKVAEKTHFCSATVMISPGMRWQTDV